MSESDVDMDGGVVVSAFEMGRLAGETGGQHTNPFEVASPDHHHFETGRKFASRNNRSGASSYWQRRRS